MWWYSILTLCINGPPKAGEALFVPAGTIHEVANIGSGNAAELATYVVEKGKPRVVLVT
jgi:quercetin dioxygenase-like cupin family protein